MCPCSPAEESFYLHGFIAHVEQEEEEGQEPVNKTDLRSESELVKQNMKKVCLQLAAGFFFYYMQTLFEYSVFALKRVREKRVSKRLLVHFFLLFISYNIDSYVILIVFLTIQKELMGR